MRALGLCPEKLEIQAGLGEFHGPHLPPAGGWRIETLQDGTIAHIPRTQTLHTEMVEPINSQPINLSYLLQKPVNHSAEDECLMFLKGYSLYFEENDPWEYEIDCENGIEDHKRISKVHCAISSVEVPM